MSLFSATKEAAYRAQRAASQGSSITLLASSGGYVATYACATKIAAIIGNRTLTDLGDGIFEVIPELFIPHEEMLQVCRKLSARYSIALVEAVCGESSSKFVCVWLIPVQLQQQAASSDNDIDWDSL